MRRSVYTFYTLMMIVSAVALYFVVSSAVNILEERAKRKAEEDRYNELVEIVKTFKDVDNTLLCEFIFLKKKIDPLTVVVLAGEESKTRWVPPENLDFDLQELRNRLRSGYGEKKVADAIDELPKIQGQRDKAKKESGG